MNFADLTIIDAVAAMREGDITAEGYANALLARAEQAAGLNSLIHHNADDVRAAARRADGLRNAHASKLGPLHGIPLVFKDNIDTAGIPTTGGTPALKANRPQRNAPIVQSLVDAGAIVFGKANMHELAFGITSNNAGFGPVRNPYDPSRIPGGSSGGNGVAVAARIVPGGIGTDTGGSVRIPAAHCGIVGFRPTTGRWSAAGLISISHTRDTAGPMARSVADCALLDRVATGASEQAEPVSLKGLRIGLPRGYFWESIDVEMGRILEDTVVRLKEAGVILIEADIPDMVTLESSSSFPIVLYETVPDLEKYLASHMVGPDYSTLVSQIASPDVRGILQSLIGDGAFPEAVYREAISTHRPALQEAYRKYFAEHQVDAVIFPTVPLPPAKIGEDETVLLNGATVPTFGTYIRNTSPGSIAGLPGLSLPAGMTSAGLPVGIEIDGPSGSDQRLLAIGLALEALLPDVPAPKI